MDDVFRGDCEQIVDRDRRFTLEQRVEGPEERVETALVEREQQFLLAREVEIDGALAEPGLGGDLGNARDAIG